MSFHFPLFHMNAHQTTLEKFTLSLNANSKYLGVAFKMSVSLMSSSTYCKRDTLNFPFLIPTSESTFFPFAYLTNPLNPPTTTKKRKGANISPCLSPLWTMNSFMGLPFTRTNTYVNWRQHQCILSTLYKILFYTICKPRSLISRNHMPFRSQPWK